MSKRTLPRQSTAPANDGDQVAEFLGPDDDGWSTTTVLDWIGVCPDLGPTAYRLYMIVRSLLSKYGPVRKLTLTELCKLLPGKDGAPSSLTRVRDAIRELTAVGLFTTPEGGPLTTSSSKKAAGRPLRVRVNDRAPKGYEGHRSAYAKLAAIRAEGGTSKGADQAPDKAGRKSDQGAGSGRKSDPPGRKSDPPGRKNDHDSGSDLGKRDPSIDLSKRSSLSGDAEDDAVGTASAGAVTEERETSPTGNHNTPQAPQVPEQRPAEKTGNTVAETLAAQWRAAHGTTPGRRQLAQVAADATDALTDGDAPEWLTDAVVPFMVARRYLDLGRAKTHPSCPPLSRPEIPRPAVGCPAGECDGGGIVYRDPDLLLGPRRCACRTHHATV